MDVISRRCRCWCSPYYYRYPKLFSSLHRFQSPQGLSCEVSKATAANQIAPIHPERRHLATTGLPYITLIPSVTGVTPFWPCSQTARRRSSPQGTQLSHQPIAWWTTKQPSGDAAQAVPVADGSISSGQIPTSHLQTSGGVLSTVVT